MSLLFIILLLAVQSFNPCMGRAKSSHREGAPRLQGLPKFFIQLPQVERLKVLAARHRPSREPQQIPKKVTQSPQKSRSILRKQYEVLVRLAKKCRAWPAQKKDVEERLRTCLSYKSYLKHLRPLRDHESPGVQKAIYSIRIGVWDMMLWVRHCHTYAKNYRKLTKKFAGCPEILQKYEKISKYYIPLLKASSATKKQKSR
jgi:hypothetical protein